MYSLSGNMHSPLDKNCLTLDRVKYAMCIATSLKVKQGASESLSKRHVITVGILHWLILSFEGFLRNV